MSTPTPPYGDAARVSTLAGVDQATALALLDTACWIIDSYVWPGVIPTDPVPVPVDTVATLLAVRLNAAATGPQVVAESMGSYSYRLAVSESAVELAGRLPAELAAMLGPWAPGRSGAATLTTGPDGCPWPIDWWQRDLEEPDTWVGRARIEAANDAP